jgi:starch phosphorylase
MSPLDALQAEPKIAYFSMEIGLRSDVPTYSGGLGVLAGDTIKACADLKLPVVGVTLVSRQGYFRQELDLNGRQHARPSPWDPSRLMTLVKPRVKVVLDRRPVAVGTWLHWVDSPTGGRIPVLFLDTDFPDNAPEHRELTSFLYGRDAAYRLRQEAVLGLGGGKMLQALGITVRKYHMNEGHSALLTLELLERFRRPIESVWQEDLVWDVRPGRARAGSAAADRGAQAAGRAGGAQHDVARPQPEPLRERRRQEARRGLPRALSRLRDLRDHQRRALVHVDVSGPGGAV